MKKFLFSPVLIAIYATVLCTCLIATIMGSRAVTAIAENASINNRKCVIIDAGHGGEDGGATSCTGVLESGINLEIALRLDDLMHLLGIKTVMIRTEDISVYTEGKSIAQKKISDLKKRVEIANETANALLVSIHQNYFSDGKYSGAQVFYNSRNDSNELATYLQTLFINSLNPGSHRNAKSASGIYLMQQINCCGVLVECGFVSNPEEEAKLRDESYQKKICCVIAAGCSIFINSDSFA